MYEIRDALRREISEALHEPYTTLNIEISEMNTNGTYSVKGTFKVTPFLSTTIKRKGNFEAKLDEDLKIKNLKITEEAKQ
jgi:hypothetical protein